MLIINSLQTAFDVETDFSQSGQVCNLPMLQRDALLHSYAGSAEVANFGELRIYHFRLMPATNRAFELKSVTLGHALPLQHDC